MEGKASERKKRSGELEEAVKKTLEKVKHKILILSGKGGVGKSTVAANMAAALAGSERKVGLLDVDLHGPSIPMLLGLTERRVEWAGGRIIPVKYTENLEVISIANLLEEKDGAIIWRGPLKMKAITQFIGDVEWGHLDYLVVDSPPGTGDEPLTVAQLVPGAHAIVVSTPQELSLADVRRSVSFCREVGLTLLGLIENMSGYVCPRCGNHDDLFGTGGGERTAKKMGVRFLGKVPIDSSVVKAGDQGLPSLSQKSDSPAATAFHKVVLAVFEALGDSTAVHKLALVDGGRGKHE
jgi:ATP-binding protein involved in chromosome partitioning